MATDIEMKAADRLQSVSVIIGLVVIPAMSVAFAISFSAIVFTGDLAPFLGQGISLTLFGAGIFGILGSLFFSYRGTVAGPQDVTTILLSGAALSIAGTMAAAPAEALLSTIVVLIIAGSLCAGVGAYVFGKLRLGYMARFVPYPVMGGFLAATGYLLASSALGMMAKEEVNIYSLFHVITSVPPMNWLPWMVCAAALTFLQRRGGGVFTLPLIMLGSIAIFYAVLFATGAGLGAAAPLLLGPFEDINLADLASTAIESDVNWMAILSQAPTLVAIAGLTILGTLLNSTGIELTVKQDSDFEKDLRAAGVANVASGLVGGLPGYQLIGETILAREFGMRGMLPGISAGVGCLLALFFGTTVLGYIPAGAIAMLIAYLGFDLLMTWLWDERKRLSVRDYGVIILIVIVAAFVGFLEALGVGLLAAVAIFVLSFARLDVVRLRSTAATRRSRVERPDTDLAYLSTAGEDVVLFELVGYIFFGSANALTDRILKEIKGQLTPIGIILDFSKLLGLDASAAFSLRKMVAACNARDVTCIFAGMKPGMLEQYLRATPHEDQALIFGTLDDALMAYEDEVLNNRDVSDPGLQGASVLGFADQIMARDVVPSAVTEVRLERDEILVEEGSTSTDIFILKSGDMRAEVQTPNGRTVVIARFLPGALIGEVAYYGAVPRTATLIADAPCVIYRFEPARLVQDDINLAGELHSMVASHLARRLVRNTKLIKEAGI